MSRSFPFSVLIPLCGLDFILVALARQRRANEVLGRLTGMSICVPRQGRYPHCDVGELRVASALFVLGRCTQRPYHIIAYSQFSDLIPLCGLESAPARQFKQV